MTEIESLQVGIKKYRKGNREWLAMVCDGSPQKLFLGLVGTPCPYFDFVSIEEEENGVIFLGVLPF